MAHSPIAIRVYHLGCKNSSGILKWNLQLKFNNFKAREYDYDSLEAKLLGWNKEEIIEEEFPLGIGWLGGV